MLDSVTIDGVDLHYQTTGEGLAIVFLHGFSGNHFSWYQQIPAFSEAYRCIAPDQRGFGLSADAPDGPGVSAFPEDLRALLDHLGVDRAALVGHSMSGWTVASFATQYPDRVAALVLSGTPGGLLAPEHHRDLLEAAESADPEEPPVSREQAFLSESIAELNRHGPDEWEAVRPTLDDLPLDADRIVDAGVPAFLIAGEHDPFMPGPAIAALSERLAGCEHARIEDAWHSANFERPDAFNRHVRSFVDEHHRG